MKVKVVLKLDVSIDDEKYPNKRFDNPLPPEPIGEPVILSGTPHEVKKNICDRIDSIVGALVRIHYGDEEIVEALYNVKKAEKESYSEFDYEDYEGNV